MVVVIMVVITRTGDSDDSCNSQVVRDLSEISRREGVGILNLGSEMR